MTSINIMLCVGLLCLLSFVGLVVIKTLSSLSLVAIHHQYDENLHRKLLLVESRENVCLENETENAMALMKSQHLLDIIDSKKFDYCPKITDSSNNNNHEGPPYSVYLYPPRPRRRKKQERTKNEMNHYFYDGVLQAPHCFTMKQQPNEASIWIFDGRRIFEQCEFLEQLVSDRIQHLVSTGTKSLGWKIIQFDFGDTPNQFNFCMTPLLQELLPLRHWSFYKRSIVQGREGYLWNGGTIVAHTYPNYTNSPRLDLNYVTYGVRSDFVSVANKLLLESWNISSSSPLMQQEKELHSSLFETGTRAMNPVFNPRPGHVRYFWYYLRRQCHNDCQHSRARSIIGERLRNLFGSKYKVEIGMVGTAREEGRKHVEEGYLKDLLSYQIVVVTQRDTYEGQYRLMEALVGGALVLSDSMVVPPRYLVDGQHYIVFYQPEDMLEKVMYYLNCPKERLRIAYNGWKVAMEHYRSFHMMEKMIQGLDL